MTVWLDPVVNIRGKNRDITHWYINGRHLALPHNPVLSSNFDRQQLSLKFRSASWLSFHVPSFEDGRRYYLLECRQIGFYPCAASSIVVDDKKFQAYSELKTQICRCSPGVERFLCENERQKVTHLICLKGTLIHYFSQGRLSDSWQ